MQTRFQRTIARTAEVAGFGLFGGLDCRVRFQPAAAGHGIAFVRTDLPTARPVPATTDFVVQVPRRTAIFDGVSTIETIEHAMAALAGLWVDNCLVEVDAPELPIGDGSSRHFVEALLQAGIVEQNAPAETFEVVSPQKLTGDGGQSILATPAEGFVVGYALDYGEGAMVAPQSAAWTITPESFVNEIASARTFVLASEIAGLQKLGYGLRATPDNLLVFDDQGIRDNSLRWPDECARHKVLDAIGDLALCGGRPLGNFHAEKSGHHLNHAMASGLRELSRTRDSLNRRAA